MYISDIPPVRNAEEIKEVKKNVKVIYSYELPLTEAGKISADQGLEDGLSRNPRVSTDADYLHWYEIGLAR